MKGGKEGGREETGEGGKEENGGDVEGERGTVGRQGCITGERVRDLADVD